MVFNKKKKKTFLKLFIQSFQTLFIYKKRNFNIILLFLFFF